MKKICNQSLLVVALFSTSISWALPLSSDLAYYQPAKRFGAAPTGSLVAGISDISNLEGFQNDMVHHSYTAQDRYKERLGSGILYTCRSGFLDIDHVREAADWTAYYFNEIKKAANKKQGEAFSIELPGFDRGVDLKLNFQPRFASQPLSDQEILYFSTRYAFLMSTWHEVMTWNGYRTLSFLGPSEKVSAFTYEDLYSNAMGALIGAQAIKNPDLEFEEAVDVEIKKLLKSVDAVSKNETKQAYELVQDRWWNSSKVFPQTGMIIGRSINVGLNNEDLSPWIVPGFDRCGNQEAHMIPSASISPVHLSTPAWSVAASMSPGNGMGDLVKTLKKQGFVLTPDGRLNPDLHLEMVLKNIGNEILEELGEAAFKK